MYSKILILDWLSLAPCYFFFFVLSHAVYLENANSLLYSSKPNIIIKVIFTAKKFKRTMHSKVKGKILKGLDKGLPLLYWVGKSQS